MRTVYDLRDPADRHACAKALGSLVETFEDRRPIGHAWDALEQVIEHLERRAFDRAGADSRAGLLTRALARLLGDQVGPRASMAAEDYARLEGQRAAFREVLHEVKELAREAHEAAPARR